MPGSENFRKIIEQYLGNNGKEFMNGTVYFPEGGRLLGKKHSENSEKEILWTN